MFFNKGYRQKCAFCYIFHWNGIPCVNQHWCIPDTIVKKLRRRISKYFRNYWCSSRIFRICFQASSKTASYLKDVKRLTQQCFQEGFHSLLNLPTKKSFQTNLKSMIIKISFKKKYSINYKQQIICLVTIHTSVNGGRMPLLKWNM